MEVYDMFETKIQEILETHETQIKAFSVKMQRFII